MVVWFVPALVAWLTPYRFVILAWRIGHLATEMDFFLKQRALGVHANIRPVVFNKRHRVTNPALLSIWARHVKVITNRVAYDLLRPFTRFSPLCIDLTDVVSRLDQPARYQEVVNEWGDRPPVFQLPEEMLIEGHRVLRKMGIPECAWFVPVHSRDGLYSPTDEYIHSYRNCDIENYGAAVDAIIGRGGWCVRMGERGTVPLPERQGLVNYPDTEFKSDWMDLFLCNQARFFLGNTSGLKLVSTISGVPCALANMAPHECVYGFLPSDISIPKLLRLRDGTIPRFEDIFASKMAKRREFESLGATFVQNTTPQIRDLALEMLDVLDGKPQRTAEDELRQEAFRRLLKPRHYTYGTRSRIGTQFLREHAHLL